jgi:hypothetical protein
VLVLLIAKSPNFATLTPHLYAWLSKMLPVMYAKAYRWDDEMRDGIAMGHGGMLYSLSSGDLIADAVEYMVNVHCADALVCISNCDKITPGMLMAARDETLLPDRWRRIEAVRRLPAEFMA